MNISIVVVCYNEEKNIGHCLRSLLAMDYQMGKIEILVIDNNSVDKTQTIVNSFIHDFPNIRLINNKKKGIAISRNIGITQSRYPFIAFTDADCVVPPEWLSVMASGFNYHKHRVSDLAAVGGTNTAPFNHSVFYDAINIMLKTFLGNRGSTQGKEFRHDTVVSHIPTLNILYAKEILQQLGGFDEHFRFVCEDPELNYRITRSGYTIMFLKNSCVIHRFKPGVVNWARKMFSYGRGRTQLINKHPDLLSLVTVAPSAMVVLFSLLSVLMIIDTMFAWPIGIYLGIILIYSLFHTFRCGKIKPVGHVVLLYIVTHMAFGSGQIFGMRKKGCKPLTLKKDIP